MRSNNTFLLFMNSDFLAWDYACMHLSTGQETHNKCTKCKEYHIVTRIIFLSRSYMPAGNLHIRMINSHIRMINLHIRMINLHIRMINLHMRMIRAGAHSRPLRWVPCTAFQEEFLVVGFSVLLACNVSRRRSDCITYSDSS